MWLKNKEAANHSNQFKVYKRRWIILITVVLLNISNGATWISYFPIAPVVVSFYGKPTSAINWFSSVFMIIPALCFPVTTYLSNRLGLKFLVHVGSAFNVIGALIKAIGTSKLIHNKDNQYIISLTGQTVAAVAQTFSMYIPTKVSSAWFPETERKIATTILSFAYSFGLTLTQLITPLYVKNETDIPLVTFLCLGLATLVEVLTLVFVRSSHPKTPPSESAEHRMTSSLSYWQELKHVFSSLSFVMILIMLSCGIGSIAALNTLTEQIICNVGYSSKFAGASIAIMYCCGYLGSVVLHPLLINHTIIQEMFSVLVSMASFSFILISEFLVIADRSVILGIAFALFGFFSIAVLPTGLELSVESTYPVDESLTTGLVYFFGQIYALIVISFIPMLARESQNNDISCDLTPDGTTMDYSIAVCVLMVVFCLPAISVIILFKPVFKRTEFEAKKKLENQQIANPSTTDSIVCASLEETPMKLHDHERQESAQNNIKIS